jgi:hypothetical protein
LLKNKKLTDDSIFKLDEVCTVHCTFFKYVERMIAIQSKHRLGVQFPGAKKCGCLYKRLDLPGPVGWMEKVEPLCDIPQLRHRRRPQRRHAGFSRTNLLSFKLL